MGHRGSQLYFHITRYVLKEEGRTLFLLSKVKVEFRHLFSLQKRFSLCSYHNINANIVVFADWLVYSGITLVFKFQAVWTTSYHTQFRFIWTNIDRNKKNRNIILKSRKKSQLKSLALKYIFFLVSINLEI